MTREEWIAEFVKTMCAKVNVTHFPDGISVEAYATETAASYYEDYGSDPHETPASCAETDISYWEED